MTLLYMYFENTEHGTYKGIKPNPKGYTFDNRFIVEFDKENKTFNILDNPNYVQIYNNAISNFSCIVGKNGSGKTTFMELLITNIAWGITEKQPSFMVSIYYTYSKNNDVQFFIQNYQSNANDFTLFYNKNNINFKQNKSNSPYKTNMLPNSSKFIFHSLSPFDKIFYSIGVPFKKAPQRIPHFREKMKYIGNQNIFKGDPKHEIQTITNLIRLFTSKYFAPTFEKTLGYKFSRLEINYDKEAVLKEISKAELLTIIELKELSIFEIGEINNLVKRIKLIRNLSNKGYLEFKIFLEKEHLEMDYFYLSSGEKTMISYFVNISNAIREFKKLENKTFIILIDEVELHLHPEWQRNFVNYMNEFFKGNQLNVKFQFIIATHSPFILSDIIEEQIIFINEEEKKSNENNTFGANIYDIFEKGFFLENSIGKCSEKYIQELSNIIYLFKALQQIKEYKDYFLLRNYLEQYYEIDRTSGKSIEEQKNEANNKLFRDIVTEIKTSSLTSLKDKFSEDAVKKYILTDSNALQLNEKIQKYIEIIGEPTIKTHLIDIYDEVKDVKIDDN